MKDRSVSFSEVDALLAVHSVGCIVVPSEVMNPADARVAGKGQVRAIDSREPPLKRGVPRGVGRSAG
jgi:hypothetical protein